VLEGGVLVGRIFFLDAVGPEGRPWMWASGHSSGSVRRAAHSYESTREAAMAAFAKNWRGGMRVETRARDAPRPRHPWRSGVVLRGKTKHGLG
jgi:hypothetical protein